MSIIHGSVSIGDLDVAPAFERREHHEQVGGAVTLVLVVTTSRAPRFHRDWHARLGEQLLGGLVQANQWSIRIARSRVDGHHVYHRGHERAVGLGRNDPLFAAMRLESVLLKLDRSYCRWRGQRC
jgi:hypothetical protein